MLFMFHTKLRKPADMPAETFYGLWREEAVASLEAVQAGIIPHIWKVAGKDEVIGVIDAPDADALDRGLHELPVWRSGNTHMIDSITWTVLRPYEQWADQLEGLAQKR